MFDRFITSIAADVDFLRHPPGSVEPMVTAQFLAERLLELRELAAAVRQAQRDISALYVACAGERSTTFEGLGTFKIQPQGDRKDWDHERLTAAVAAKAMALREVDPETGWIEDVSDAVRRRIAECARLEWRVGELRKLGLDPDRFSKYERTGWGVELPSRPRPEVPEEAPDA